jgi:hypothetical protein
MTTDDAIALYSGVLVECGERPPYHSAAEWHDIADEMRAIVAAKSDREAGKIIAWWKCWDRTMTATKFAALVRKTWLEMKAQ